MTIKLDQIKYETMFVRNPKTQKSDEWQDSAHRWLVVINGQEFNYYTGLAYREYKNILGLPSKTNKWQKSDFEKLRYKNLTENGFKNMLHNSEATPPKLEDVLYALTRDADALDMGFEDWAENFGYDVDSRKALQIYLDCQENANKLIRANVAPLATLTEHFQDY